MVLVCGVGNMGFNVVIVIVDVLLMIGLLLIIVIFEGVG